MLYLNMKNRNEIVFRLVDQNAKETYSVWDINNRKWLRNDDPVVSNDGRTLPARDTQYIKQTEFAENFPNFRKNKKMERKVIFEGEEQIYPMPVTANVELEKVMAVVRGTGKDPMTETYKVIKTGIGIATRYTVELANRPVEVGINIDTPAPEVMQIQLNETEQKLVDAIKKMGQKYSFEQVKGNFTKYEVPEDRAKQIYEVYLK